MTSPHPDEPLFPGNELRAFCAYHFDQRSRYLEPLSKGQSSPLYLLDHEILRERAKQFYTAFMTVLPKISIYYAVKSNNHPAVAATLLQENLGLDVSSGLELDMALKLGAKDIIFSGPGKTNQELKLAVDHADCTTILIDSFGELARLEKIAAAAKNRIHAGVRLTTGGNCLWRKFGIPPERLPDFWKKAQTSKYVKLEGIQFHTSWNLTPDRQLSFIASLGALLEQMQDSFLNNLQFIDLGGGYWPEQGEWLQQQGTRIGAVNKALGREVHNPLLHYRRTAMPLRGFARQLAEAIEQHIFSKLSCRICFEPGRWLCHDAMHLLMTVIDKKADDLAITDAGTNSIGWERFENDYFPVLNLSRPALVEHPCNIMGSLCTPHDIWGYSYWGKTLQEGDLLMIPSQGAYTYSLRQNFIKETASVVSLQPYPEKHRGYKP